ncbi:lipase [Sinomonas cellulolyticus]|uniref:Alpha/beta fold hydrolase n=1 Tax=Sinomonas cellulolyticus TaxID=2801916 RepID=A0ABS1K6X7_9MICC|nr:MULTISPECIES: alpha/beta fold hydrolase [Sinomonas]MBL0707401.1 alpha/beta fold hydrolase [Sinomonas cellulolyticus]GHG51071.1 lipase [Sinomonas sp. KCTC 49339]
MRRFRLTTLLSVALLAVGLAAAPAQADSVSPDPPGANDWTCKPSAAHPYPVVLVPGTFETMAKNWSLFSPVLKDQGYCVFSLNYGVVNGVPASGPVRDSAAELGDFVSSVLGATGAKQVDLVGHSQGGMMPRYYMGFLGGAKYVHQLIGIAPSSHGTQGLIAPSPAGMILDTTATSTACQACADQYAGSEFVAQLNSIGDTVPGPAYTVISTRYDEVVTPYTSQALAGSSKQVTNLVLQDYCPLDTIEHDQSPNDPNVWALVSNALLQGGPADPAFRPVCV